MKTQHLVRSINNFKSLSGNKHINISCRLVFSFRDLSWKLGKK